MIDMKNGDLEKLARRMWSLGCDIKSTTLLEEVLDRHNISTGRLSANSDQEIISW